MIGNAEWLNNPEFSKNLILTSGLHIKPENENRGILLELFARWVPDRFSAPRMALRAPGVRLDMAPAPKRVSNVLLDRLVIEFKGYHIPTTYVCIGAFLAAPDRRIYVRYLSRGTEDVISDESKWPPYPQYLFATENIFACTNPKEIKLMLKHSFNDLEDQLRIMRGWGWLGHA